MAWDQNAFEDLARRLAELDWKERPRKPARNRIDASVEMPPSSARRFCVVRCDAERSDVHMAITWPKLFAFHPVNSMSEMARGPRAVCVDLTVSLSQYSDDPQHLLPDARDVVILADHFRARSLAEYRREYMLGHPPEGSTWVLELTQVVHGE